MSANAGRTAPIGPTDPYAFEAGSQQRTEIAKALTEIRDADWQFASTVDGQELRTGNVQNVVAPHNHSHVLGQVDFGGAEQAQAAVDASVKNARWWGSLPWEAGGAVRACRRHARVRVVAREAQRSHDAGAVEDHLPG